MERGSNTKACATRCRDLGGEAFGVWGWFLLVVCIVVVLFRFVSFHTTQLSLFTHGPTNAQRTPIAHEHRVHVFLPEEVGEPAGRWRPPPCFVRWPARWCFRCRAQSAAKDGQRRTRVWRARPSKGLCSATPTQNGHMVHSLPQCRARGIQGRGNNRMARLQLPWAEGKGQRDSCFPRKSTYNRHADADSNLH